MLEKLPRVLVISNNCFSNSGSNGRTLANFFIGWPIDKLAQFYIHNEIPNFEGCNNYFRVTDKEALKSLLSRKQCGKKIIKLKQIKYSENTLFDNKKINRTAFTLLMRNLIWSSERWKKKLFDEWLNSFNPEIILLQAGDAPFMLKLATKVAVDRKVPLVIYNSEDYYFKTNDYIENKNSLFFKIFQNQLKKQYKKTMKIVDHVIYNTETLQQTYLKEFYHNSSVIMTSTQLKNKNSIKKLDFSISYLGNLGVGRHESLIDIANTLKEIHPGYSLDIYGKIPNLKVKEAFDLCENINYRGLVSYEEVIECMYSSNLIIHTESFSEFYINDLRHAFSTKISDSLACGTSFLIYAPASLACTQYLLKEKACHVVTASKDLKVTLEKIINSVEYRNIYFENQIKVAQKNHDIEKNCAVFREILKKLV